MIKVAVSNRISKTNVMKLLRFGSHNIYFALREKGPLSKPKKSCIINGLKAIPYGTFLRTENERFRASKSIINLMDPKLVFFSVNFSVIIFGTASNRK